MERNKLQCAARGCDGCTVCTPTLRERCEELANSSTRYKPHSGNDYALEIESFALQIRNETLEEAAMAMRNKGYHEAAFFVDWFRTHALAAVVPEDK